MFLNIGYGIPIFNKAELMAGTGVPVNTYLLRNKVFMIAKETISLRIAFQD